ncbi:MAG: LytTR family DNA-binding domain-containing protein [Flavobacteriales bacterium]|nr:LytTR family DNA-binding domain-containing protein [Flavobacteriales bacterium]
MKVVIIEDEQLLAQALKSDLEKVHEDIIVQTILPSIQDAIDYFKTNEMPDLFFSDIRLTDGLSFRIFERLDTQVPVIFCTAYDEYALEAFKANGIDYLLKPHRLEDLERTVTKYQQLTKQETAPVEQNLSKLFEQLGKESKESNIIVYQGESIIPIKTSDINLAYLENGITYLLCKDNKKYHSSLTLDQIFNKLNTNFFRVNRQHIINRENVKSAVQHFARKLKIIPKQQFENPLIVSKAKVSEFMSWLENA